MRVFCNFKMAKQDKIGHVGIIKSISEQTIEVTIISRSACSACHARGACGMSEMQEKVITAIRPSFPIETGEKVMVYAAVKNAVYSVMLAYVVPSVILLVLLGSLTAEGYSELTAAIGAIGGLALYFLILYLCRKKIGEKIKFSIEKMPVSGVYEE